MRTVMVQQGQPLQFLIERAKIKELNLGAMKAYDGDLTAMAGGTPIWTGKIACMADYSARTVDVV